VTRGKITAFEESLRPYGIKEMVRTGKVAMLRGTRFTSVENPELDQDVE
jgi:Acetolactate synthase, small (regulatory) subunit